MRKIVITGGSGFIGSHFHNLLPNEDLINFDLASPTFKCSSKYVQGDIREESDVRKVLSEGSIETIISLAAKHHDFGIGHDEYFDTNEYGTKILCKVASEFGIRNIIFYSSVAVYGTRIEVSNEETIPNPDSPYGASKLAGEKILLNWSQEDPSRKVLIIRPTVVYGSNNKANMFNLIRQIDSGFYFHISKTNNIKSIAFVKNLIQATLFLKDGMKNGVAIYNYSDEPQMTSRAIGDTIASLMKRKIRFSLPISLALFAGWPFDLIIILTGINLPVSSARIRKLATQTHHSAQKLLNEGFKPNIKTIDGLKEMVDWYKQEKLSKSKRS